jgi:hypothetical protein
MPDTLLGLPAGTAPVLSPAPLPVTYAAGASNGVAMNPPPADVAVSIAESIRKVCAIIPPDQHTALVARVDLAGANVIVARRFDNGWQADAYFGKVWQAGYQAGFEIMKSW